ncbi:MAC/perforin domain-containing protein [Breznakiellaceae bacterium SP9]
MPSNNENILGLGVNLLSVNDETLLDVKWGNPILKGAFVTSDNIKEVDDQLNAQTHQIYSGDTLSEICESLRTKGSLNVDYGMISANVSASFNSSTKNTEERSFFKIRAWFPKKVRYFTEVDNFYNDRVDNRTEGFTQALKELTPKKIFKTYGTHLMTSVYLGGRLEANFTRKRSSSELASDFSVHIDGAYTSCVKVSADVQITSEQKAALQNCEISVRTIGGGDTAFPVSPDDFLSNFNASYKKWVSSLADGKYSVWNFPSNGLMPVWELTKDKDRKKALQEEYDRQSVDLNRAIDATDVYVTDIYIADGHTAEDALALCPVGYHCVPVDLNSGAGGRFLYLCYQLGTKENAFTEIFVAQTYLVSVATNQDDPDWQAHPSEWWVRVKDKRTFWSWAPTWDSRGAYNQGLCKFWYLTYDLNAGAKSTVGDNGIWLAVSKDTKVGNRDNQVWGTREPIKRITAVIGSGGVTQLKQKGWIPVFNWHVDGGMPGNLNERTKGNAVYLMIKK